MMGEGCTWVQDRARDIASAERAWDKGMRAAARWPLAWWCWTS